MIFFAALTILALAIILCIIRAIKGPTPFDRILSISSDGCATALSSNNNVAVVDDDIVNRPI